MIDRRRLLLTAAATAAVAPTLAQAATTDADGRLNTLLDGWFEADIDESPEHATSLGLDKGARAGLSSKLIGRRTAWSGPIGEARRLGRGA